MFLTCSFILIQKGMVSMICRLLKLKIQAIIMKRDLIGISGKNKPIRGG